MNCTETQTPVKLQPELLPVAFKELVVSEELQVAVDTAAE